MTSKAYILTKNDKQVITKICTTRFVGVTCLRDLDDIIDILNIRGDYSEEYGTFGYTKEIKCDLCLVSGEKKGGSDRQDIIIYGENDKKYWLSTIIDLPSKYSTEWIIDAIQAIIKTLDGQDYRIVHCADTGNTNFVYVSESMSLQECQAYYEQKKQEIIANYDSKALTEQSQDDYPDLSVVDEEEGDTIRLSIISPSQGFKL